MNGGEKMKFKKHSSNSDNISKKLYLSVKEAVKYSGLSEYSIRKLIANKEIEYLENGRKFLINRVAFKTYLEEKSREHLGL